MPLPGNSSCSEILGDGCIVAPGILGQYCVMQIYVPGPVLGTEGITTHDIAW